MLAPVETVLRPSSSSDSEEEEEEEEEWRAGGAARRPCSLASRCATSICVTAACQLACGWFRRGKSNGRGERRWLGL
eukprot:362846-Rhodomonas_salina.1